MKKIFLFALFSGFVFSAQAESVSPQDLYQKGVAAYQKQDFETAEQNLLSALKIEPNNPHILYNLGLAAFQNQKVGAAIGYWRKALFLDPGLKAASQSLTFALKQTQNEQPLNRASSWESFRVNVLLKLRRGWLFFFCFLSFTAAGWLFLSYLGHRRRAFEEKKRLPSFPYLATVCSVVFLVLTVLSSLKIYDDASARGTITAEKTNAKTGPEDESAELFELSQGTEVLVLQMKDNWAQISYPGGLTGWIPATHVFQTSGDPIW